MSDLDRGHPPARVVARPTLREHHVLIRGMRQAAARRQLERRIAGSDRARLERHAAGPVINDPADPRLLCTHDGFIYGFRAVPPPARFAARSNGRQHRSRRPRSRARRRSARRGSDPGQADPEPPAPERRADNGARR